jgi:hypothetical protein
MKGNTLSRIENLYYEESKMKYTPLRGKRPFLDEWQKKGMTFDQAFHYDSTTTGAGLILGEESGGIVAIDFDGPEANDFYNENFERDLLDTSQMIWSSGREMRWQLAWFVPREYWELLQHKKVGPKNKLEFRWTGNQSVMPPSYHPDTKGNYFWVRNERPLTPLPQALLDFWVLACNPITIPIPPVIHTNNSSLRTMRNDLASSKVMNSIIKNLYSMSPNDKDTYHCKIWKLIKSNEFSYEQKQQILIMYNRFDLDTKRQTTISELLKGK